MAEKIDKALLEGLTFSGSKAVKNAGKTEYQKFTRELTPDDVLDFKDTGSAVTIVTKDGKKYSVAKKKAKA